MHKERIELVSDCCGSPIAGEKEDPICTSCHEHCDAIYLTEENCPMCKHCEYIGMGCYKCNEGKFWSKTVENAEHWTCDDWEEEEEK